MKKCDELSVLFLSPAKDPHVWRVATVALSNRFSAIMRAIWNAQY